MILVHEVLKFSCDFVYSYVFSYKDITLQFISHRNSLCIYL